MKFFQIIMIGMSCVASASALADDSYAPTSAASTHAFAALTVPAMPQGADSQWAAGVRGCYDQANKRRELGLDVPVQFTVDGKTTSGGLPPTNQAFKCHVDGRGTKPK